MLRRVVLLGLIVSFAGAPAAAQQWARKMFKETRHDLGYVARGSKAEYAFEFQNIYLEDVHVASVRSSCGCTIASVEKEWLKTYEKSAVVARINTPAFTGRKGATITVTFDEPYHAEVQLHVRVYIRSDVVFSPDSVQFGSVQQGAPAEKTISVNYAGRGDWKILEVQSANPHLKAEARPTRRRGGQVGYELVVKLDGDTPPGYIEDHLLLRTNDRRATEVPLKVEGRVVSGVTVSPGSLFLGVVEPGQTVTRRLVVKGKQPFRVLDVRCDDESFRFDTSGEDKPKIVHVIPVTFVAGEDAGRVVKRILIETDLDSARPELSAFAVVAVPKATSR